VTGVLIWLLRPVLTPFAISIFFGYLGDPLVDWLETKRMSRTFAVFVVFFVMTALLALVVFLLVPLLGAQIGHFISEMPTYAAWIRGIALPWIGLHTHIDLAPYVDPEHLATMIREHMSQAGGVAATVLGGLSRSSLFVIALLTNICLVPVLSFYFLRDWDVMVAQIRGLLPRPIEPTISRLAQQSNEMLGGFLRGQMAVMVSLGIIYTFGLWLVGLDLALLIGLIAGLVSFVPYLGVITGLLLSVIAALAQYGDGMHVLMVLAVFTVGPMLESFVLIPKLVGNKIGMHPVGVIFALMAGGALFGFLGVLLALPFSAVGMVLLRYGHERYTSSAMYAGPVAEAAPPPLIVMIDTVRVDGSDDTPESPAPT
jgi:predicted PurR-regulated permease PerM